MPEEQPGQFGRQIKNAMKVFGATIALSFSGVIDPALSEAASPNVQPSIAQVNANCRCVALTFDDGPSEEMTPQIINTLNSRGIKATFFMTGVSASSHPFYAQQVAANGMEIGNHTLTHTPLNSLPADDPGHLENGQKVPGVGASTEIYLGARVIKEVTGIWPELFRAPVGLGRNDERINRAVQFWGETPIGWSTSSEQAFIHNKSINGARNWLVNHTRPGSIVLMHDGHLWDNRQTSRVLGRYVDSMKQRHYRFVTVGKLLKKGGYVYKAPVYQTE